ncbi:succinate dehydrogenase assembly factor 2-A, mitochondrial-like isoform X2 [Drosophila miranda]|uniref:succinate dehydrogenase assembly factor 2-A, mitochondrial-like isoform X2 n=1 Tax=Drosophila miranda TaxID=7229 RepID=UPI0007E659AE|nr:succinate dehydrogenase assembly factor 2-A, mitochondrial-like isoform X2 [Drosophila miranda]
MLRQLKLTLNISRWIFMPWQRQASASSSQMPPFLAPISDDVIVDYEDPDYLPLPEYPVRPNEPLETRKQRSTIHFIVCSINRVSVECWRTIYF